MLAQTGTDMNKKTRHPYRDHLPSLFRHAAKRSDSLCDSGQPYLHILLKLNVFKAVMGRPAKLNLNFLGFFVHWFITVHRIQVTVRWVLSLLHEQNENSNVMLYMRAAFVLPVHCIKRNQFGKRLWKQQSSSTRMTAVNVSGCEMQRLD